MQFRVPELYKEIKDTQWKESDVSETLKPTETPHSSLTSVRYGVLFCGFKYDLCSTLVLYFCQVLLVLSFSIDVILTL